MLRMTEQTTTAKPKKRHKVLSILDWAPRYQRVWLRPDLIAGITVAALVVPKALGYASIAGVPIQHGLYAAAAGAILYAFFGGSGQIATGPSSALAAVAAGALVSAGIESGGEDAVQLVAAITIASGLMFLLLTIFRMGWISQFLSKPVITGFLFGAAIEVVVGELPKITGTSSEGSNTWQKLFSWIESLPDTDTATLVVGVTSLVVIFGLKYGAPKVPGALVLVVGGLVASALFDLGDRGLALIGDVPSGLPTLALPDWAFVRENINVILTAAAGLLLIGFSQTAGDARSFASKHKYRVDIDQESLAQGACNIGSGLVQGIPVSTSLSASSLNDTSGAKTQVASLTTGVMIVLTMLFLAPLFSDLPKAVLAALIIQAVVSGMMDVPELQRLYRVVRADFWIAIAALVGVLTLGVLGGVIVGRLPLAGLHHLPQCQPPHAGAGTPAPQPCLSQHRRRTRRHHLSRAACPTDRLGPLLRQLRRSRGPAPRTRPGRRTAAAHHRHRLRGHQPHRFTGRRCRRQDRRPGRLQRHRGPNLSGQGADLEVLEADDVIERLGADHVFSNTYDAVADLIPPDNGAD